MKNRPQASHDLHLMTNPGVWLCAVAAAFSMATAHAANSPDDIAVPADSASLTPKQAYDHDKQYCQSRERTEDRATCLKEASRAYQEARAGILEPGSGTQASAHPKHHRHMARRPAASTDTTSTSGTSGTSGSTTDDTSPKQ